MANPLLPDNFNVAIMCLHTKRAAYLCNYSKQSKILPTSHLHVVFYLPRRWSVHCEDASLVRSQFIRFRKSAVCFVFLSGIFFFLNIFIFNVKISNFETMAYI